MQETSQALHCFSAKTCLPAPVPRPVRPYPLPCRGISGREGPRSRRGETDKGLSLGYGRGALPFGASFYFFRPFRAGGGASIPSFVRSL